MSARLDEFRKILKRGQAALITDELNIRYLCGVPFTDGMLVITPEKAYILTDSRYIEAVRREASDGFETLLMTGSLSELINSVLSENGTESVGYEEASLSCLRKRIYEEKLSRYNFFPLSRKAESMRSVKDAVEKENIVRAQRIAESAFEYILGFISPDVTEADVALELEYRMKKNGADGIAFDTIAVSGKNSSMPHGVPGRQKLGRGFLTMDFGAKYCGYCSDMTRTVCIGEPDAEMKVVYETVLKAQLNALGNIKAGMKCSEADALARNVIEKAGYGKCFGHSLGHGVGLYIHEPVNLSPRSEDVLSAGNVVTVEPGIYIEGKFGVRIEDMVYVTDSGCENLTKADKSLIIL